jgi:hypothetical protein
LTAKTGIDDVVIPYLSGGSDKTIAANYEVFFTALDTTNCPVTSCMLSQAGHCGVSHSGNVNIESNPWAITAKQATTAGYTWTMCVQCSIGAHTFDWDGNSGAGWKITQTLDCTTALTLKTSTNANPL